MYIAYTILRNFSRDIQIDGNTLSGHRDLPGVRKECPYNDIRMDQNTEKSFQKLNDMPEISGTIMQGG